MLGITGASKLMSQIKFSEHPDYEEEAPEWRKIHDLHEGKHSVLVSNPEYLWPHELERRTNGGSEIRAIRELRTRYLNLLKSVVTRWVSFLFRNDINVPDSVIKMFAEEFEDVTGSGEGFQAFCKKQIGVNYVLFGRVIVLVDSFGIKAQTKEQAKALGVRPYVEVLNPLEVKDWQISDEPGRKGKFDFLRCEYEVIEPRTSPEEAPVVATYCKVLSSVSGKYTVKRYKAEKSNNSTEWKLVDERKISELSEIPVSAIINGESLVEDATEQQLMLLNLMSAESSILNAQAFQKIFVTGVRADDAKLAFGEYVVNFLPENATVNVVEAGGTDAVSAAINATIDRLFRVAFNQIHSISSDSKEAPGAESQREAKEDFKAFVISVITELQDVINQWIAFYAQFKGIKNFTDKVELDTNISLDDIDTELAIFQAHKDDFKKIASAYREIVRKRVNDMNLPNMEEIDKEIEAADFSQSEEQGLTGGVKDRLLQQVAGGQGAEGSIEEA